MKLCILQCDTVREQLAAHGQCPERFATLFQPVNPSISYTIFDVQQGVLPKNIDEADAYLITGSRHGVNDGFPWINTLEEFVRTLHESQKN